MSAETQPAISEAMREAVAPVTRAEVRDCIGPSIPLRRRWVDLLMQGPIARLQAEIARLTGERDAARETNRELHRRLQAAEGPLLSRVEHLTQGVEFWMRQRKRQGARAVAATRRAEAAEAALSRLQADRDAEVGKLRAALEFYADDEGWSGYSDEPWRLQFESRGRDGHGFDVARAALTESTDA